MWLKSKQQTTRKHHISKEIINIRLVACGLLNTRLSLLCFTNYSSELSRLINWSSIEQLIQASNLPLNNATSIRTVLLLSYQGITIDTTLLEKYPLDCAHPSWTCDQNTFTSIGKSLLLALTNYTCVNSST